MTILVVGASGATGQLLVADLLARGQRVRAIVRAIERLPETLRSNRLLELVQAYLLDLNDDEMARLVGDCSAVASCLGHNLNFKGIYGQPRRLVTDASRRLCATLRAQQSDQPRRFVLMNTAGNHNRDSDDPISFGQRCVLTLIRLLVPPHRDNEEAAQFLSRNVGPNDSEIEWVVVRPDTLIDELAVTDFAVHISPTRSAIFDAGKTSRINVARFMADLLTGDELWKRWKGRMPVIYNRETS